MSKEDLLWLNKDRKINIAVIGDLILDEYVEGKVNRISPEAPVPVHLVSGLYDRAGGAANSGLNIQLVGASVHIFGFTGVDDASNTLIEILKEKGIDTEGIIKVEGIDTIKKIRITSSKQQIVRIDWERNLEYKKEYKDKLFESISNLKDLDGILVSDYGKGTLDYDLIQKLINLSHTKNIPIVIDPKGNDYTKYKGATVITPNRKEACLALNIKEEQNLDKEFLASKLQSEFDIKYVLLTLGADGMYLYPSKDSGIDPLYLKAQAREVFDVSGAGDTVAAISCVGLSSGMNIVESVKVANIAAGIVVEKWGTAPVELFELKEAIQKSIDKDSTVPSSSKVKSLDSLLKILGPKEQRTNKIVFTNGCFDILHAGHCQYLEEASLLGDILIVGINSDASIKRLKGQQRPIISEEYRVKMLASLGCIDYIVIFEEDTPLKLIESIIPDVLVKGADWNNTNIVGSECVLKNGGEVKTIKLVEGLSTTKIIEKIIKVYGK